MRSVAHEVMWRWSVWRWRVALRAVAAAIRVVMVVAMTTVGVSKWGLVAGVLIAWSAVSSAWSTSCKRRILTSDPTDM